MRIYILSPRQGRVCTPSPVIRWEANFRRIMVRGPLPAWSDRIGLLPITSHVMRSKKPSMLKGFSSGGWAKRRKPNPDRRRLRCWPATCSARMHPRGNHEVQQLLHFYYWVIAGREEYSLVGSVVFRGLLHRGRLLST